MKPIKIPMSRIFLDLSAPTPDVVLKKQGKKIVCEETNQTKLLTHLDKFKPKK